MILKTATMAQQQVIISQQCHMFFLAHVLPPPVSQKAHTQTNHIMVKGPEVQDQKTTARTHIYTH